MRMIRIALVCAGVLIALRASYASELVAQEAVRYFNEGLKLQAEGNYLGAQIAYNKYVMLAPKDLERRKYIINNLGIISIKTGNLAKAEQAFREVLSIDPDFYPAKVNLGLIYDLKGQEIKALQYWARMFELDKMKPKDFVVVGEKTEPAAQEARNTLVK